ncbi:hypothetical protein JXA02_13090 [candidate division KSB1 bacterium]|nr:hypothetical protein [candidate division KSB1 bacterium]
MAQPDKSLGFVAVHDDSDLVALIPDDTNDPFSKEARIRFQLRDSVHVTVKIMTLQGEKVCELLSQVLSAGMHTIIWDGRCDDGRPATSGVFMYEVQAERSTRSATVAMLY